MFTLLPENTGQNHVHIKLLACTGLKRDTLVDLLVAWRRGSLRRPGGSHLATALKGWNAQRLHQIWGMQLHCFVVFGRHWAWNYLYFEKFNIFTKHFHKLLMVKPICSSCCRIHKSTAREEQFRLVQHEHRRCRTWLCPWGNFIY